MRADEIYDLQDTALSVKVGQFFTLAEQDIKILTDNAVTACLLSGDGEEEFTILADLYLLMTMLMIYNIETREYHDINDCYPDINYMYTIFGFDEARQYFACKYIDITKYLDLFDAFGVKIPDEDMEDIDIIPDIPPTTVLAGIGTMIIEGSTDPFEIS